MWRSHAAACRLMTASTPCRFRFHGHITCESRYLSLPACFDAQPLSSLTSRFSRRPFSGPHGSRRQLPLPWRLRGSWARLNRGGRLRLGSKVHTTRQVLDDPRFVSPAPPPHASSPPPSPPLPLPVPSPPPSSPLAPAPSSSAPTPIFLHSPSLCLCYLLKPKPSISRPRPPLPLSCSPTSSLVAPML